MFDNAAIMANVDGYGEFILCTWSFFHSPSEWMLTLRSLLFFLPLHTFFSFSVPFVTKGRFDLLAEPLCDLLGTAEQIPSGVEGFETFMKETVEPCIAHFAASCPDDMTRKTLHNKLLMQTRNDLAVVRAHAVLALKSCFDQVEKTILLVPETLPFMAELLEDSDGRVEHC